eukprot:gene16968-biopygen13633
MWREGGPSWDRRAQGVPIGSAPFPAARCMCSFPRSPAHGGARWRAGGPSWDPRAQGVLTDSDPFPAARRMVAQAQRMVAQGDARVGLFGTLGRRVYSSVVLLSPQPGAWWRKVARGAEVYSSAVLLFPQPAAWWRKVARGRWTGGPCWDPRAQGVLTGSAPFPAAQRMVAQGSAGGPCWEPRAHGVLTGSDPFPAAQRMVAQGGVRCSFPRSPAHGGARWRAGGSSWDARAQDALMRSAPFPAAWRMVAQAQRMVAQGDARVGLLGILGRRVYSPAVPLSPQPGAWWRKVAHRWTLLGP